MATRIEIPQFDMYHQIVIAQKEGYIEINDDYIYINQQYLCKIPDDPDDKILVESRVGWRESAVHQRVFHKKKDIALIILEYADSHENYHHWAIDIYISGVATPVSIFFKKKQDAESAFDIISLWWLH